MKKRILSLILALTMVLPLVPAFELPVFAATSGTTGDCTWTLDGTVLTISGNGAMADYQLSTPWGNSITKVIIEDGVTSIGNFTFYYCTSLTSVSIHDSVTSIGIWAFGECYSLSSIIIPDSVTTIGKNAFYNCSSLTIYCEAASKPSGWDSYWNYSKRPVTWGYKG